MGKKIQLSCTETLRNTEVKSDEKDLEGNEQEHHIEADLEVREVLRQVVPKLKGPDGRSTSRFQPEGLRICYRAHMGSTLLLHVVARGQT